MHRLAIACAVAALCGFACGPTEAAAGKLRFAQTSTVTNCMMLCNAQAASCQTNCIVPGAAPTGAATTTSNATASTSCQLNCSTQQISCQTTCGTTSPSP
jgi:hypothetical protein